MTRLLRLPLGHLYAILVMLLTLGVADLQWWLAGLLMAAALAVVHEAASVYRREQTLRDREQLRDLDPDRNL